MGVLDAANDPISSDRVAVLEKVNGGIDAAL